MNTYEWFTQRDELLKEITEMQFRKVVLESFNKKINSATFLLNEEYEKYFEDNQKGFSYEKRKNRTGRIEGLKKYIDKKTKEKKGFNMSIHYFLQWGDYEKIQRTGIERFVDLYVS